MVLSYVRSWYSPRGEVWQLNELSVFFLPKHFCHSDPSLSPKQRPPLRLPGPAQKTWKVLSSRSAQVDCTAKHSTQPWALGPECGGGGRWVLGKTAVCEDHTPRGDVGWVFLGQEGNQSIAEARSGATRPEIVPVTQNTDDCFSRKQESRKQWVPTLYKYRALR